MVRWTQRKYFMLGGKGGVGKTSCAASLAVKFANHGHPTLVVSTDPAHSLSDSFDQDLTGGALVPVQGVDSPLYALEINPEKTREELRATSELQGGRGVKDFMDSMGLGMLAEQLGELKLGELLDTPPPGLDEAIAISKVMQFLDSKDYSSFSRIVFDTAPMGHTLGLLSLPDFLDASIGKMMKANTKIASATSALKSMLNKAEPQENAASDKLEQLRERMAKVRVLFRDSATTEFIIVTIPTVMAANGSSRLCASLKKETVPVRRLIVNQVLPPSTSDCKFCVMRRKDQMRALDMITKDPELASLKIIQAPLVDMEIRGVAGLKFFGDMVWNFVPKVVVFYNSRHSSYRFLNILGVKNILHPFSGRGRGIILLVLTVTHPYPPCCLTQLFDCMAFDTLHEFLLLRRGTQAPFRQRVFPCIF
ncbi:ATPase GET3B-like [Nicotiana sylvestris]|uniref:ATPase GET3B-like n=1 Tax=Nicotiana sylvestris TaxID=4096 RepID=UPI00388CDFCC